MISQDDTVAAYGKAKGWNLCRRTVIVEGTSDQDLFHFANRLESQETGKVLVGQDFNIVAAGEGDEGGTRGVIRELTTLRSLARTNLMPNGRPHYRFIGLFDNDNAGRQAIKGARIVDASVTEFKDVFRLHPIMPTKCNLDPKTLEKTFSRQNSTYRGLDWELEDLVDENFLLSFISDYPTALRNKRRVEDKIHWEFTPDGKAHLKKYIRKHGIRDDLHEVISVIKALRCYMNLPVI